MGQGATDLLFRRVGVSAQQRGGVEQDAVDAVAALHRLLFDERGLQWMGRLAGAEPLEREDLAPGELGDRGHAARLGLAVDEHRAGAALAQAAAEFGAVEGQVVA